MSFQTELAERAKQYLGEDLDEKILKEGHLNQIYPYFSSLKEKIGSVKYPPVANPLSAIILSGLTVTSNPG
ncbi:hypothetical protein N3930_31465, partial [Bacillus thuringiensis]|nr:hypothetical protein [Bacillus thuringiensis]